jgi:hypothetical protein
MRPRVGERSRAESGLSNLTCLRSTPILATMAAQHDQPRLRRALLGIRREDVEALQARLAETQDRNAELASNLESVRLALGEAAGWSERLPAGLRDLATLAAGESVDDAEPRLAAAVLALAGEHLLASVDVSIGEPAGDLQRETRVNENGRPVLTIVRLGGCVVDCVWQPGVDAGQDTTRIVEALCIAVVCSLAGVATARIERDPVTQLGDERSLARHEALRARLQQPAGTVCVVFDENSAVKYRKLFGGMAWEAALSRVAAELDRIAHAHGGQAYQVSKLSIRLLVDAGDVDAAAMAAQEELDDYDGLTWRVDVP